LSFDQLARGPGPAIQTALTGLLALLWFAWCSLRAALTVQEKDRDSQARTAESPLDCLRRALAVVWLNPLTYIEFLLIPAVLCAAYSNMHSRLQFVFGLVCMTAINCYGYSLGGMVCAPLIRYRRALQIFDLASGGILTGVALILATTLMHA
jgi:threonine/homoserine/homoserine lactone efflux protein